MCIRDRDGAPVLAHLYVFVLRCQYERIEWIETKLLGIERNDRARLPAWRMQELYPRGPERVRKPNGLQVIGNHGDRMVRSLGVDQHLDQLGVRHPRA